MNVMIYAGLPYSQQVHFRKQREINHKRVQYNEDLEIILDEVCKYLYINVSDVKSKNRMLRTKIARFYYCYLSRTIYKSPFQVIGDVVYRNHATVIHANNTVKGWLTYDKEVVKQLEEIETNIERRLK